MKKKYVRLIAVVAMCAMLVCSFASCSNMFAVSKLRNMEEKERAFELIRIVGEKMDALRSYTMDLEFIMNFEAPDIEIEANGKNLTKIVNQDRDDFSCFSETEYFIFANDVKVQDDIVQFEGYHDGKTYFGAKQGEFEQKLCSLATVESYWDFLKDESEDYIPTEEDATVIFCEEDEDGTWSIELSSDSETKYLDKLMGDVLALLPEGITFSNSKMLFIIDETLRVTDFTWEFVFESEDKTAALPKIILDYEFTDFNQTKIDSKKFEGYTEVDDVIALRRINSGLKDRLDEENGTFDYASLTTIVNYNITETKEEKATIHYQTDLDDMFSFDIDLEQVATKTGVLGQYPEKRMITYQDGKQTIKRGNGTVLSTKNVTQKAAETYIKALKVPMNFNVNKITDITVVDSESGVYKLTVAKNSGASDETQLENEVVTVTMKDGKITKLHYEYQIPTNSAKTITVVVEVSFAD